MITIQLDLLTLKFSADCTIESTISLENSTKESKTSSKKHSPQKKIQKIIPKSPSFSEFCNVLLEECPDIRHILSRLKSLDNNSPDLDKNVESFFTSIYKQYIAVKGHVQSGKTKFIMCVSLLFLWFDISPIIVLRNLQSDAAQFLQRLDDTRGKFYQFLPAIKVISSTTKISSKRSKAALYLCLGNGAAMKKIQRIVGDRYICILDEVDSMDMVRDTSRHQQLSLLKQNAFTVFGISATMLDPLVKERISTENIILLQTSSDYKGMKDIQFYPIKGDSSFSSKIEDDLTMKQPGLLDFLHEFSKRTPINQDGTLYPNIALINVGSTIAPYQSFQKRIQELDLSLCTILYNASGINVWIGNCEYKRNDTIAETLQWLKESFGVERAPTIAIFSCMLAGRGVSFVSEDYQWHLNVLYLCVSDSCDEAELLQKVRLAGRYNDTIPLELYTKASTYADMLKAYYKQEEIVFSVLQQKKEMMDMTIADPGEDKDNSEMSIASDFLSEMSLAKDKFSKRRVIKDGPFPVSKSNNVSSTEWNTGVYVGKEYAPKEWYETYGETVPTRVCTIGERLVEIESDDDSIMGDAAGNEGDELRRLEQKMFPTWSKKIGESKIASWMDSLHPSRKYSRTEILDLCKEHDIVLQHVLVAKYEKSGSRGYGKILTVEKGMYQLHPYLVESHQRYF